MCLSALRLTPELLNESMVKEMEKEACEWTVVKHYSVSDQYNSHGLRRGARKGSSLEVSECQEKQSIARDRFCLMSESVKIAHSEMTPNETQQLKKHLRIWSSQQNAIMSFLVRISKRFAGTW